jgi:hypothetical protein
MDWTMLALALVPILAPVIVAGAKKGVAAVGAKIPNQAKPVINALVAAILGQLVGTDPATSMVLGQVGKSVRDAHDKA